MSVTQFLSGLNWRASEFSNLYVVGDGKAAGFICTYNQRNNRSKKWICDTMPLSPGGFDFHHIIERQHLADISFDGRLYEIYNYEMPTVLLQNLRHQLAYNAIFHIKETRHIYVGKETESSTSEERQEEAIKLYHSASGRRQLMERVEAMREIYLQVYSLDVTVRRMAMNIFDHYIEMIY